MNPDSPFTKSFFTFFNDPEPEDLLRKDQEELTRLINKSLYEQVGGEAKYYTQSSNRLAQLKNDENYMLLKVQLEAIKNKLKNFSSMQGTGSAAMLEKFFDRLLNPTSDHITLFYKEQGKRILEEISILLFDNSIDFNQRIKIINEFFASDGLAQCIDNCYLLILDVNQKLKSLKRANHHIYYQIRNYATGLASDVAASRPFGSPKTYVEIACELANIPIFSHEIHARNFFLLYAKENNFPINALPDVIAENLRSRLLDFDLQHAYLKDFKDKFTINGILDYLSGTYYREIGEIIKDSQKSYSEKQNLVQKKLELLGIDDQFSWHEIFYLKEDNFVLKSSNNLKITIIDRLTRNQWLRYWVDLHVIEIDDKKYHFYYYKEHIMVSWLSFEDESDKKLKRISFLDLLSQDEIEGLSQNQKESLCFELINKRNFITNAKELDFILTKYPTVESYISKDQCIAIIRNNDDVKVFASLVKNLSRESGIFILEELSEHFVKRMLAHAFLYANIETRIKEIPKKYMYDLSPLAVKEVNSITNHLLRNLIDKEFRQFENFYFPQFKSVDYLNRIDFSYCNLKKAFFAQSVSYCDFNSAYLDEVKFLMKLNDVSFSNVNLKTTEFLGADYFKFEEITLYKATLSTQSFKRLLKADVFDFSFSNLVFVNFQDILKTQIKLDFSHANLEGVDLSNFNLKKIKFFNANLKKTNLLGSSFRKKNINERLLVQGSKLDWVTVQLLHSVGITNFNQAKIVSDIIIEESFGIRVKFKEVSFKEAEFFGSYSLINFVKCDLSSAKFLSGVDQNYGILVNIMYKRCNLEQTQFISVNFFTVKLIQCQFTSLNLVNVQLSTEILFSLYDHGHRDFRGVKLLSGRLPEKITPFPFAGASLSEDVFVALYKQGLRDFRSSNLYHFNLRGTLIREGISEPDLKLESTVYKQSLLVCAQKRSERAITSISKKCIAHFLIKGTHSTKELIKVSDIPFLAKDLRDHMRSTMFNQVIKEISLDFSPLELIEKVYKINFYWSYLDVDQGDLIKIVHFLKKSTQIDYRLNTRLVFHLSRSFFLRTDTALFYKDLNELGFRKIFINYMKIESSNLVVSFRKKAIKLNEDFQKIKKKNKNIITTFYSNKPSLNKKIVHDNLYSFNKNLQKFTHVVRLGARKGYQYQLGLASMHLISAAIMTANTETKLISPQQKQELIDYAQFIARRQAQERGASEREYSLALNIAKQCIDRGECYSKELVSIDIKDTLLRARPPSVAGTKVLWRNIRRFFSGIGYYFKYRFTRLKKIFESTDEERTHLEREKKDLLSRWSPQLLPSSTFMNDTSIENLDYIEEDDSIDNEELDSQEVRFIQNSTEIGQEGIFFYLQFISGDLTRKRMYNWYDYPLLVNFIKSIERTYAELGFQFQLNGWFNEADLAGLLYELWLALDRQGVTDQADPQFILELLQKEEFVKSIFSTKSEEDGHSSFNQSDEALGEPDAPRIQRSISLEKNDTLFFATQLFSNTAFYQASNELTTDFSATTDLPLFYVDSNDALQKQVDPSNQDFSQYRSAKINTLIPQKFPLCLQTINDNLFFLNYIINCFKSYFISNKNKNIRNKNGLFSFGVGSQERGSQFSAQNDSAYLENVDMNHNSMCSYK